MLDTKLVAIFAPNPALASILAATLRAEAPLRVAEFETAEALRTFMRISPVDLVIFDADGEEGGAATFITALRSDNRLATCLFDAVALTRADDAAQEALRAGGFDQVLRKPVASHALIEAASFWLVHNQRRYGAPTARATERRPLSQRKMPSFASRRSAGAEVVPLFGSRETGA